MIATLVVSATSKNDVDVSVDGSVDVDVDVDVSVDGSVDVDVDDGASSRGFLACC